MFNIIMFRRIYAMRLLLQMRYKNRETGFLFLSMVK